MKNGCLAWVRWEIRQFLSRVGSDLTVHPKSLSSYPLIGTQQFIHSFERTVTKYGYRSLYNLKQTILSNNKRAAFRLWHEYSNFRLVIAVIHHRHTPAMHTCPRVLRRIKAVRVHPLWPADLAAYKRLLRFTAVALEACSWLSLHNGGVSIENPKMK